MSEKIDAPRLCLRPCRDADVEDLRRLWTNAAVRLHLFDERTITLPEARSFVDASTANFERYGYGLWIVQEKDRGHTAGFAGFLHSRAGLPDLIYGIHPDLWGCGYATEAAGAVLRYAFDILELDRIVASVDEPNRRSIRVLEKLGIARTEARLVGGRHLLFYEKHRPAREAG